MHSLILFFKGFFVGIGKIIPGVSGSVLAISLGIYEEVIQRLNHLFHNFNENARYLFPLGLGVICAILLGSNVILYCLECYYVYTMILFIGFIVGSIPSIVKIQQFKSKDFIIMFMIFVILYFLYAKIQLTEFIPENNLNTYFYISFLGFLDAVTTIMPGISGTATYMVLGSYNFILKLFANPFAQIFFCILFVIGLIIGIVVMLKLVNFCFQKYAHQTWIVIFSFLLSSIFFFF